MAKDHARRNGVLGKRLRTTTNNNTHYIVSFFFIPPVKRSLKITSVYCANERIRSLRRGAHGPSARARLVQTRKIKTVILHARLNTTHKKNSKVVQVFIPNFQVAARSFRAQPREHKKKNK